VVLCRLLALVEGEVMDPITAWAMAFKAACEMVTAMVDGQTPEQKQKVWDWFIADQERWRKWLHLDS
jgi:hypothetical protein